MSTSHSHGKTRPLFHGLMWSRSAGPQRTNLELESRSRSNWRRMNRDSTVEVRVELKGPIPNKRATCPGNLHASFFF